MNISRRAFLGAAMFSSSALLMPSTAHADNVIDFDYYYSTLRDEYAKRGIDYEIIEVAPGFIPTIDELNYQIDHIDNLNSPVDQCEPVDQCGEIVSPVDEDLMSEIQRRSPMYVNSTFFDSALIDELPIGAATIQFELKCLWDAQYSSPISYSHFYTYPYGYEVNLASWTEIEKSVSLNEHAFYCRVRGRAKFELYEPNGNHVGKTVDKIFGIPFELPGY